MIHAWIFEMTWSTSSPIWHPMWRKSSPEQICRKDKFQKVPKRGNIFRFWFDGHWFWSTNCFQDFWVIKVGFSAPKSFGHIRVRSSLWSWLYFVWITWDSSLPIKYYYIWRRLFSQCNIFGTPWRCILVLKHLWEMGIKTILHTLCSFMFKWIEHI